MADFHKLLSSVEDSQAFRLPDGKAIKSLNELVSSLNNIDDTLFNHHVNNDRNDFASWIEHCFDDKVLSKRLSELKTRDEIITELKTRLSQAEQTLKLSSSEVLPSSPIIEKENTSNSTPLPSSSNLELDDNLDLDIDLDASLDTSLDADLGAAPDSSLNKSLDTELDTDLDASLDVDLDSGLDSDLETDLDKTLGADLNSNEDLNSATPSSEPREVTQPEAVNTLETQNPPNLDVAINEDLDLDSDALLDDSIINNPTNITQSNLEKPIEATLSVPSPSASITTDIPVATESKPDLDVSLDSGLDSNILSQEVLETPLTQTPQNPLSPIQTPNLESSSQILDSNSNVELTPEEEQLLKTPTKDLSPKQIFIKKKLEKTLGINNISNNSPADSSVDSPIGSTKAQVNISDIGLSPEDKLLLNTPNKELDPKRLFKKIKLQKSLGNLGQAPQLESSVTNLKEEKQLTENSSLSSPDLEGLSSEEKLLLDTPNKELDPKRLFTKIKLQKKLKLNSSSVSEGVPTQIISPLNSELIPESQEIDSVKENLNLEKPVDLLNMSSEEFYTVIGVNPDDEFNALVYSKDIIQVKQRKRLKTGVPGFDDLIGTGIVEGTSILVSGGPGSGKTTFCIQQLGWAAAHGENCLFISLEEKEERLVEHMKGYGINPEKYLEAGNLKIKKLDSFKLSRSVEALLAHARGELMIDIDPIMDIIPHGFKPDRVVLDSLSSIAAAFGGQPEVYRIYVEQLFSIFEKMGATSFIITEIHGSETSGHGGVEDFIADGVVNFYNLKKGHNRQPAVEILKMRGVKHLKKVVPFEFIPGKGIEVYPLEDVFYDEK